MDAPAIVGSDLVFPCRNGLWAWPLAEAWRLDRHGRATVVKHLWKGSITAWKATADSALVADEEGVVHDVSQGGEKKICALPWAPRQISTYRGSIVAVSAKGFVAPALQAQKPGDWRLLASSPQALLLIEGRRLFVGWHDERWEIREISDHMASGLLLGPPGSHDLLIGIPAADHGLRAFRLRFPLPPESLGAWTLPREVWFHRGGRPAAGHSFVLASKDPTTNQIRMRAFSVTAEGALSPPVTSNVVRDVLVGPFLAGGVVYAVVAAEKRLTVHCYHLVPSAAGR